MALARALSSRNGPSNGQRGDLNLGRGNLTPGGDFIAAVQDPYFSTTTLPWCPYPSRPRAIW